MTVEEDDEGMIFSNRILTLPEVKLPAVPVDGEWGVWVSGSGESYLVLTVGGIIFSSFVLNHPYDGDYVGVVERAATSVMGDWWACYEPVCGVR